MYDYPKLTFAIVAYHVFTAIDLIIVYTIKRRCVDKWASSVGFQFVYRHPGHYDSAVATYYDSLLLL